MSLRLFAVVGVLWVGLTAFMHETQAHANFIPSDDSTVSNSDQLAFRMHKEGLRSDLNIADRLDLADIAKAAVEKAAEMDLDCEITRFMEVRLVDNDRTWLAGYEALAECDDAPSGAAGIYFDSHHAFVGALAF